MSFSLFVSYSRQDSPFADGLLDELEDRGFNVWLDYQSLTPAKPWAAEIERGIQNADVVLLVVSKSSMASEYVAAETQRAFEINKRIVLIILEARELPPWLETNEWVDFRKSFKHGISKLTELLTSPATPEAKPPQKGFAAPWLVWLSFLISIALCVFSLPSLWTLYVPYYLFTLPYRILKRNFNYFHVRIALLLLPLVLLASVTLDYQFPTYLRTASAVYWGLCLFFSLLLVPLLLLLLRSRTMRRWGKPIASKPTFANLRPPDIEKPQALTFTVDAALEDTRYKQDLVNGLQRYAHREVTAEQNPEVTLVLISRYKTASAHDPELQVVYPILLQSAKNIDPKLQRVQWIDFRRGLRNVDAMAQLLPEPSRIFKSLGIAPAGSQIILPTIVQALVVYLLVVGIFTIASTGVAIYQLHGDVGWLDILITLPAPAILLVSIFLTSRSLINRKGRIASFRYLLTILILGIGIPMMLLTFRILALITALQLEADPRGAVVILTFLIYLLGTIILVPLSVWRWKDLRRWFPYKTSKIRSFFTRLTNS